MKDFRNVNYYELKTMAHECIKYVATKIQDDLEHLNLLLEKYIKNVYIYLRLMDNNTRIKKRSKNSI
ncbi:unnamed protein product [Rhizophagus irregularis]|nr:unnamed protein product [Rhizophagus irregularis]